MSTNDQSDPLHRVSFCVAPAWGESVEERMALTDWTATSWTPEQGGDIRFELFFASVDEAAEAEAWLRDHLPDLTDGHASPPETTVMPADDWQNSWKQFFHVDRVSDRIVIKPTWESYTEADHDTVIDIDPGMSFGTGQHGTTRACLQFLDRYVAAGGAGGFLDLGCGSGILAIAAAKLGLAPVCGLDHDAVALENAHENLVRNGVESRVALVHADLTTWEPPRRYPLVAANILASVLADCHLTIAACVAPGGQLLLAGILADHYPEIRKIFAARGFRETDQVTINEWTSGWFSQGG